MGEIDISVCCITYNHEKYIAEAIESVLAQKCTYRIEMIISEDKSPDNTANIISSYAEKYPDIIKPIFNKKNLGAQANANQALAACKGKYIAVIEGDDKWIDPYKLQKQADFMEANPDFTVCFSKAQIEDELNWEWSYDQFLPVLTREVYTIQDFILSDKNMIPTATLFFRNCLPTPMPELYLTTRSGDIVLQLLLTDKGKARYFDEAFALWRNHSGGITKTADHIERYENSLLKLYADADKYFNYKYHRTILQRQSMIAKSLLIYSGREKKGMERLRHYFKNIPRVFKYSQHISIKEILYYHILFFAPNILKLKK